jgi:excisionase family DNA binding protein
MAKTTRPFREHPRDAATGVPSKEVVGELGQQQRGQPGDVKSSDDLTTSGARGNLGDIVQRLERLLTVDKLAELWQISERTVRRMTADGRLPVVRIGRAVRIPAKVAGLEQF